ncbi:SseB family protein [Arthrobacter sp. TMN-37]
MTRQLPAHIAAALAGNTTDSAGRPWAGRDLSGSGNPLHNFDEDDGQADPGCSDAVRALIGGTGSEEQVIQALAPARVFIPIVAQLAGTAEGAHGIATDKEADMALVTLRAPDGRSALPVFTSSDLLAAWHSEARPVAAYAARAALAAVAEKAELLVVDPGADFTFVVRRPAVWALAQQETWTPSYRSPDLSGIVAPIVGGEEAVVDVVLEPGSGVPARTAGGRLVSGGGAGPELRMSVRLQPGLSPTAVRDLVERLRASLQARREFVERVDSLEIRITS